MTKRIPGTVALMVRGRDRHRCVRCSMKGAELHHRRSRAVVDAHQHCPCNLVYLCGWGNHTGCHGWAHSNPFEARGLGLLVSRSTAVPGTVPLYLPWRKAWALLTCEGQMNSLKEDDDE